ncbi:hypothetical protein Sliba_61730 [Streptomyces nigrescens]|uniref:PPE family domain-containing protein n=1 Tax=Streptomyces nigrescens TaxID=1920 RepID=A0A640TRA5_STRNI|nr:hypothetical protein Sliba_61730 [Streptomyces libani subsp. libani]GGV98847.1 hypothetical protein GCM10010500_48480 [Streptomyces libani subsp. libani]
MGSGGGHSTDFSSHTLETLKAMVRDAQPNKVSEIADHWMYVHDQLAGNAPDGSVKDLLDRAVADVREYWHGAAAEAFEARAKMLSTSLKNGSLYAKNTSHTLKAAAIDLLKTQRAVTALQDSEAASKSGNILQAIGSKVQDGADWLSDFGARSDDTLKQDLANGKSTSDALEKHRDTLSRGREIALQAAAHMEKLGASYNVKAQTMRGPGKTKPGEPVAAPDETVPPPEVAAAVFPVMASPRKTGPSSGGRQAVGGSSSKPSGGEVTSPRHAQPGRGAESPAGSGSHRSTPKAPLPGTALDGVRGGVPTPTNPPSASSGGSVIGSRPGEFGSGPGGPVMPPGGQPAIGGRGPLGGRAPRPGTPRVPGMPPAGRTGTGQSAVPGAPGQPGQAGRPPISGAGGPGASGKGGARGRQGGMARRPGGVVGEPSKPALPGRSAQGGSGLHRSRGGALNRGLEGPAGARGPMAVPPGGRSAREEKERRGSSRPDYLVEDEDTWIPQRDLVPGVVGMPDSQTNEDAEAAEQRSSEARPDGSEGNSRA